MSVSNPCFRQVVFAEHEAVCWLAYGILILAQLPYPLPPSFTVFLSLSDFLSVSLFFVLSTHSNKIKWGIEMKWEERATKKGTKWCGWGGMGQCLSQFLCLAIECCALCWRSWNGVLAIFLCVLACKYLVFQLKTSFFFLKNGTIGYKNSRLDNHVTCRENISLLDLRRPF